MTEDNVVNSVEQISPEALAHLGEGHIAYVNRSARRMCPDCFRRRRRCRQA